MSQINNNGYGGVYHNNVNANPTTNYKTTNHVYLNPNSHPNEFDNWMRQVGTLIQVASEYRFG